MSAGTSRPDSVRDSIDPDVVVVRVPGLFSRRVGSEYLIEGYIDAYSVNASGEQIWLLCGRSLTIGEIADRIADRNGLPPDRAFNDVVAFLLQLQGLGFITMSERGH